MSLRGSVATEAIPSLILRLLTCTAPRLSGRHDLLGKSGASVVRLSAFLATLSGTCAWGKCAPARPGSRTPRQAAAAELQAPGSRDSAGVTWMTKKGHGVIHVL